MGACRGLSCFIGFTRTILEYYTNLVLGEHLGAKVVWNMADLELVMLALIRFLVVVERDVVGYDFHDARTGHGGCGVTTPLSSSFRRRVDHYGFVQLVGGCPFDPTTAHLAYGHSPEIHWSLRLMDC